MNFLHEYNFLSGEKYAIKTIPFNRIREAASDVPGIYSWYIRPKPGREDEVREIMMQVLQQTNLKATLEGNIRLKYEGTLTKKNQDIAPSNLELFRNMFLLVPYPLYIGISLNLSNRLNCHISELEKRISTSEEEALNEEPFEDHQLESENFGIRLSQIFSRAGVTALDCLFVRLHEMPMTEKFDKDKIRSQLLEVEHLANSLFNPVFGRR